MKTLYACTALLLSLATTNLHADTFAVSLKTGGATDLLVETPIAGGYQFTYENVSLGASIGIPPVVSASDSTFLATYVVSNGIGALNVTDVCAKVTVDTPLAPCQQFAFSFTDLALPIGTVISADLGTSVLATANVASFAIAGGSVALGGGEVDFSAPPPAATPEPSSLALVGTGLVGVSQLVRRRYLSAR